jgi:peptidoglycan-associated lipoprotein
MNAFLRAMQTVAVFVASAALLAACSSTKLDDTPVESRTGSGLSQPGAGGNTRLVGSGSGSSGGSAGGASSSGADSANANSQTNVATMQAGGPQGGAAGGGAGAGTGTAAARPGAGGGVGAGASSTLGVRSGAGLPGDMSRVVFFDFDSFVLREDARPVVEAHARMLMADRSRRLVIDGHTDERGSREYNLALGQKRADAVARALVLLGVQDTQIEAVSFGEERPSDRAAGEAAWAKNRRAELKDRQ